MWLHRPCCPRCLCCPSCPRCPLLDDDDAELLGRGPREDAEHRRLGRVQLQVQLQALQAHPRHLREQGAALGPRGAPPGGTGGSEPPSPTGDSSWEFGVLGVPIGHFGTGRPQGQSDKNGECGGQGEPGDRVTRLRSVGDRGTRDRAVLANPWHRGTPGTGDRDMLDEEPLGRDGMGRRWPWTEVTKDRGVPGVHLPLPHPLITA